MLKTALTFLVAFPATLLGFSSVSHAAEAVDPQDGSLDLAKSVYDAMTGGHWAYAAAIALVLAVALARKGLGGRWQWMHTDEGSAAMVFAGSFGSALAASLAGGGPLTAHLAWTATLVAFGAVGGYATVKKIIIMPLAARLPAWLSSPLTWFFVHASDPTNAPAAAPAGNTPPPPSAN